MKIKYPLFFFEDYDLYMARSIGEAEGFFEPFQKGDKITGFDSEGRKILLKRQEAESIRDEHFLLHSIEESPTHKEEFISGIKKYLSSVEIDEDWYTNASLEEMVSKVIECQQKPRSFREKIIQSIKSIIITIFMIFLCGFFWYLLVLLID